MSKLIKYGIFGVVERYVAVKAGKATINIQFSGGTLDSSGVTPATFTTKNVFEQKIIENHPEFKKGVIQILSTQVLDDDSKADKKEVSAADGVTNVQQARQYMLAMGVPMEKLQNKAAILEAAKEKEVVFSNWT